MDFIASLINTEMTARSVSEHAGRAYGTELGIVKDREDPDSMGRVRCTTASKGGQTLTAWLWRRTPPGVSFPVPPLGATILIDYIDGDIHKGCYQPLTNLANPAAGPDDLRLFVGSTTVLIKADGTVSISGFDSLALEGASVTIEAGAIALNGPTTISGNEALVIGSKDNGGNINVDSGQ